MREIQILSLLCFVMGAVLADLWSERIPNGLVVAGLGCGLAFQTIQNGIMGPLLFAGGAGLPLLLFGVLYYCRMVGAGDIKLFCLVGGYLGPAGCFCCVIFSIFFGGMISAGIMIRTGSFSRRMYCLFRYVGSCSRKKEWKPYMDKVEKSAKFCFSVPVLLGVLVYVVRS